MSACGAGDGGVPRDAREGGYSAQDFVAACHIHPAQTASGPLLVGPLLCLSHHFPPPSRDDARIAFASLASATYPSASQPLMSRDHPTARVEGGVLFPRIGRMRFLSVRYARHQQWRVRRVLHIASRPGARSLLSATRPRARGVMRRVKGASSSRSTRLRSDCGRSGVDNLGNVKEGIGYFEPLR